MYKSKKPTNMQSVKVPQSTFSKGLPPAKLQLHCTFISEDNILELLQTPLPPVESTALADMSNRSIGGGLVGHAYTIPQDDADSCLIKSTWLLG